MKMNSGISRRLRRALVPAAFVALLAYFAYHALEGANGLWALRELDAEAERLSHEAAVLHAERERLESRVALLRPDNLDPDLLDEEARRTLGFVRPDEVVVLQPVPTPGR